MHGLSVVVGLLESRDRDCYEENTILTSPGCRHWSREAFGGGEGHKTHTTICLRPNRGLRMNLRVRRVTGLSLSAMVAVL